MAFGSGSATGVARADVEFRAETGKFEVDVGQAKQIYNRAVESMSDATLRMSVAQEKLDRAISRFGPESLQARQAAVNYRRELSQLRHEEDRVSHSARRVSADLTRVGRGSIAASGAFKGLGNALFFASGAFAGGFGLIYALRTTISAAAKAEVSVKKLAQAVRNAGVPWRENRKFVLDALDAQSRLSAFDDEELQDTFGALIIRTKDVNEALRLNALSAGVARARNVSLDAAMRLVLRASLGQTSSLRRLGIDIEKVTTEQDKLRASGVKVTFAQRQAAKEADARATRIAVIAQLEAKFSKQSEVFARTAAGRQAFFNKILEDTQEIIGIGILPTVNRLLTQFTDWLDKANRTGDTQREVNRILKDATTIVHGLVDAFKAVKAVADPFVDLMGGLHNTIEALALVWVAFKVKAIAGFVATSVASKRAAESGIVDATAFGRAWDIATRPRNMIVTTTTTGVPGAPGAPPPVGRRGVPPLARGAGAAGLAVYLGITLFGRTGGDRRGPLTAAAMDAIERGDRVDPEVRAIIGDKWKPSNRLGMSQGELDAMEHKLEALARRRAKQAAIVQPGEGRLGGPGVVPGARGAGAGGGAGGRRGPRPAVDIELDISRAQARGNEAAEIKYHRELADLYRRQAANLERRKNLTLLQKQKLTQLYSQIDSEEAAIDSIISGQQTEARARAQKRAQAARERHTRLKERLATQEERLENALLRAAATEGLKDDGETAKALIAFYRKAAENEGLTAREQEQFRKKALQVRAKQKKAQAEGAEKRLDLKEQRLRNAVDRAELSETLKDDEKTLKALIAFYRAEEKNMDLAEKARNEAERKRIAAQKKLKKLKDDDKKKGKTAEELAYEILTGLHGIATQFGSDIKEGNAPFGQLETHAVAQTNLLRQQNRLIEDLTRTAAHPYSRYSMTELTAATTGVGF